MGKGFKIILVIILVIILAIFGVVVWYNSAIKAVDVNSKEKIEIKISIGSNSEDIAKILDQKGLIKSKLAFKIYVKLNKVNDFQAGIYELEKSMNISDLVNILKTGTLHDENQVAITFIEGKNMNWYANKIAEHTNNTKEQVFNLLEDGDYIDTLIDKYWFLTNDIKNENIYYPLEGYLYPDTYFFDNADVSVKEIFETLLNQTEKKLKDYRNDIEKNEYSIHELLTIASIVETEGIYPEDRKDIASVIYNRLNANMAIQSDVTTYYAVKLDIGQRDLYQSELNTYNPYNTRGPKMEGKLPVGPISSVSINSIEAALKPNNTDYIFFVADKNGKVYFNRTNEEHSNTIKRLQQEGLWYEF